MVMVFSLFCLFIYEFLLHCGFFTFYYRNEDINARPEDITLPGYLIG